MPQDNERIIEISAELSQTIKRGVIELLNAGAPAEMVMGVLSATEGLDRAPERLANIGGRGIGLSDGMATAEFMPRTDPAIAALSEKVDEILRLSAIGIELCKQ